jgi:hypothetical protein
LTAERHTPAGPTSEQLRRRALAAIEQISTDALGSLAVYDFAAHRWNPRCPFGDACSVCDARGLCTRAGRLGQSPTAE